MKALVKVVKEVEIEKIIIDIHVPYVGDTDEDDVQTDLPLLNGNQWKATVMVGSGQILDWPDDQEYREMFCKVCDAGLYTLIDDAGDVVVTKDGYVPNGIVPGEYGDYIHLKIGGDGVITNWPENPSVDDFFSDDD